MTPGNTPLPKDITSPERIESLMPTGGSDQPRESSTPFRSLMKESATPPAKSPPTSSPFDLAGSMGGSPIRTPSLATIQSQALQAQTTLGDLNAKLSTPGLKVKPSTKYLLKNKLSDAAQQLRAVNAKVGGAPIEEKEEDGTLAKGSGPIQKFLGYVSAGQASLAAAQKKIHDLSAQGDNVNPAEFLLIQIKLNKAQQLLDYSSILLSKAVDDMKMMFNVQL